jgi:4-aminobutyrate aminotransferase
MSHTQDYLKRDEKYLSPALARTYHIVLDRAEGSFIIDQEGSRYLDFTSGIAVNQIGHAHPEVVQAIAEQAAKCVHTSCVVHYPANIELAEKLASIMPGDINCTFFSNSGAEAVDGSIKLVKLAQPGRNNIIVHKGGFHGRTIGGTALTTSKSSYRKFYEPLLPCVHAVEFPNSYVHNTESARKDFELNQMHKELERLFDTVCHPESVAAIYIEPQMGEGGYVPAPLEYKNYLKYLREICDKHGILLVFDEVQCGMGRTGRWFACDHYAVIPDVIIMAKGLSGGIPLGAFAAKRELMHKMPVASHGSTFGGNHISCKAALKLIEIIERDKVMDNVKARSKDIYEFFEREFPGSNSNLFTDKPNPKVKVRGLGLMIGLEFASAEIVTKIRETAFQNKLLLLGCGTYGKVIRLAPDLTVSQENTLSACKTIAEAVKKHN